MPEQTYDPTQLTDAQIARSKLHKRYGTGPSAAFLKGLFDGIPHNAWPYYKGRFPNTAKTVVFCSKRIAPYADTKSDFGDGSSLIEVFDGLAVYLNALARTLAASFASDDQALGAHRPALFPSEVDSTLLALFHECALMWKENVFNPPAITLAPQAEKIASILYRSALIFAVMHEYGHVALHRGSKLDKPTKELQADEWAANAFVAVYAPTEPLNVALAGALLYIRAMAAREAILPPKSDAVEKYPPSSQRFSALINVFEQQKPLFGYELEFYVRTTATFALDMRLQASEHALAQKAGIPPTEPEQFTSLIVAGLLEIFNGRMDQSELRRQIEPKLEAAAPELVKKTDVICKRIFSKQQIAYDRLPDVKRLVELSSPILELVSQAK